jgi:hypothetical protein
VGLKRDQGTREGQQKLAFPIKKGIYNRKAKKGHIKNERAPICGVQS